MIHDAILTFMAYAGLIGFFAVSLITLHNASRFRRVMEVVQHREELARARAFAAGWRIGWACAVAEDHALCSPWTKFESWEMDEARNATANGFMPPSVLLHGQGNENAQPLANPSPAGLGRKV